MAESSFNVRVNRDGSITSSAPYWVFDRADVVRDARKPVSIPRGTNNLRVKLREILNPGKKFNLYTSSVPARPMLSVEFSNATGGRVIVEMEHTRGRGRSNGTWAPKRGAEAFARALTVDNKNQLLIDVSQLPDEVKPLASGDGAMIGLTLSTNGGLEIADTNFPLYPNEWAIKPTVSETLQAKADRDTAVAAAKDAKDNETSQKLVAPKAEGQNPADAETVEALAKITKEDAKTPVATPAREAVKTPPQRKAQAQKKAEEAATTTGRKKTEKKDEENKPATTTRRRVIANTPPREVAPTEQQPVEQAPANPREDAVAQAEATVEAKVDPHTESYDYGYDDGMATVAARLRDLQEEQIDAMADRIYELQEQGIAAVNQNPVSTEEAPAVVMAFVNDMPPKQLERVIQAAGVRNLSGYKRGGRQTVDPMMVAEDMTYALIANDIARQGANAGITLKLSPTDQAYISLANKQELPPVKLSAEEKALLDVWLGDATIPLRERQDIETAFDVITTTPDQARKRILEASQMAACDTASRRNNTRIRNDEAAAQRQAAANAAERAAEQRDIAKHNAEAREIRAEERNALGI